MALAGDFGGALGTGELCILLSTGSDTVLDVKLCVSMVYSRSLRCLRLILPAEEKRPNVLFVL